MPIIFISYRREDSAGYAGRIAEHLSARFGADRVFMDVEDIAPGEDFTKAIEQRIGECTALVAMIGPHWLASIQSRAGQEDFVRHEIAAALERGVRIIPVLVGGARMPEFAALPKPVAPVARRQAVALRDDRFESDLEVLQRAISGPAQRISRRAALAAATGCVAALAGGAWLLWPSARDVNGTWIAEMRKPGGTAYRVRLEFVSSNGRLTGTVRYPTGDGTIENGSVKGARLTFDTGHVPRFETERATIHFEGTLRKGELHLISSDSGGIARGIARRR